jgi:glucose/arabinose dehydrogenase
VLVAPETGTYQFGGWTEFGPDGYLYISLGDQQTGANGQSLTTLLAKILRIDVHSLPYTIPPNNPFVGMPPARPEILCYGLRNPWRCSLDRVTGDLWIGDVGANTYEEIDFLAAPGTGPVTAPNYGWPCSEGPLNSCPPSTQVTLPIYSSLHSSSFPNQYIIGGYVYRGAAIPELRGTYFFWLRGPDQVWSMRFDGAHISELTDRTAELTPPGGTLGHVVSFGQDAAGELYMTSYSPNAVLKIVPRCWTNCDGSTTTPVLNISDFSCFLNRYAAGDLYANCDLSTTPPVLNVVDFSCFLSAFAAGCS